MPVNYTLRDNISIEAKVTFLRVTPNGKRKTLDQIFDKLKDLAWISGSIPSYLQNSYRVRAERTLAKIVDIINDSAALPGADDIVSDAAEYIVSVVAEEAIVNELGYRSIPLPEVFKHQSSQNPGFDFIVINAADVILFGEAKFVGGKNAYGSALSQIAKFIANKNDIADLADIFFLVPEVALQNADNGMKGYAAAFSSIATATEDLVNNIKNNKNYSTVKQRDELVLVAVDML